MMQTAYPHGPHPGMPQGMGPGMGPSPGPGMGQPMQMHPGGPGPNGPHVTQGGQMMAGMQPGVVGGPMGGQPSAHAMAHLGPQQAQMYQQQQQMQQMQNINLQQQQQRAQQQQQFLQQQRMIQQQQHAQQQQQQAQQQQQQQQQQGMGMGMRFQNGAPTNMTPQQLQALQQAGPQGFSGVSLPPHIAQQMEQLRQQQQQQQHVAQQHAAAQQQQAQQQHQLQMQHMQSQSSNQGQPVSQPPQGPQPPPQQGPMRPPSQMGGPRDAQPSPARQGTPQQAHTPQPQGGQPNPVQNQPPSNPQQNPQQPGPPNQSSQAQAQPPSQQTSGPPNPQLAHPMTATSIPHMQQQMLRRYAQAQATQGAMAQRSGQLILKLILFVDQLNSYSSKNNNMQTWQQFVQKHFSGDGSFRYYIVENKENGKSKLYEIPAASLPRFYWTHFDGDVDSIQFCLEGLTENPSSGIVFCARAKLIYWFKNGTQVVCSGKLSAIFTPQGPQGEIMETLQFETSSYQEFIPREKLEGLFSHDSPVQMNKQSPKMNKSNSKNRNQRQQQIQDPTIRLSDIPEAPVTEFGVTKKVQSFLEISETFSHMQELIGHYIQNPGQSPSQALADYVSKMQPAQLQQQQQPQGNMSAAQLAMLQQHQQQQMGNMPPGSRTPSGMAVPNAGPGQSQHYMSPAMANMGLPNAMNGSPHLMQTHTPSPAHSHSLAAQHSQQGTNSSATASANTSPNVSNKRRRPSGVKLEDNDGPEINGAGNNKVKPSPRLGGGGNKRVKSGA